MGSKLLCCASQLPMLTTFKLHVHILRERERERERDGGRQGVREVKELKREEEREIEGVG